jgi:DNA-binding response OmpR family regulator
MRIERADQLILIVSDDPAAARLAEQALTALDREVVVARAIDWALTTIARQFPALVLIDLELPAEALDRLAAALQTHPEGELAMLAGFSNRSVQPPAGLELAERLDKPLQRHAVADCATRLLRRRNELRRSTLLDEQSGLPNRRAFQLAWQARSHSLQRLGEPFALAMLGAPGLAAKLANATDEQQGLLLHQLGEALRGLLRRSDGLFRIHRGELLLLLAGCDDASAIVLLRRILERLSEVAFALGTSEKSPIPLVAATLTVSEPRDTREVIAQLEALFLKATAQPARTIVTPAAVVENQLPLVVVIEADPLLQEFLTSLLERENFRVRIAATGAQIDAALALPDLRAVILESSLPGINGLSILAQLRADRRYDETPIVITSVASRDDSVVKAFEVGADDFLIKPYLPNDLLARLRRSMRRRNTR